MVICFFRLRMINSTQYQKHSIKSHYPYRLVLKRYWKPMLGTCSSYPSHSNGLFDLTSILQP